MKGAGAADAVWQFLRQFRTDWRLTVVLLVPNLAGILFGYYYYWDVGQFDPDSGYFRAYGWWPFVSDSPNAVLLMSVSLVLWHVGRRSKLIDSLAFVHMMYVGLWTTYLFVQYPDRMGTYDWASVWDGNANPILFVSHMGMPLEALVLVSDLKQDVVSWGSAMLQSTWHVGNLWLDYGPVHLHPAPFLSPDDGALHIGSSVLMLATLALWWWFIWPWRRRLAEVESSKLATR